MIKLTSPSLLPNRPEYTYEFHNDKLVVKQNSAMRNMEWEIAYSKIAKLSYRYYASFNQIFYSIFVAAAVGLIFRHTRLDESSLVIERIGQIAFILGIILALLGFRKKEHPRFLDKDNRVLAIIDVSSGQFDNFEEAIDLIENKSKDLVLLDPQGPPPSAKPKFEITERNIPDFFSISTAKFYADRILVYHDGFDDYGVTEIQYRDLGENINWARMSNTSWWGTFWYTAFLASLIASSQAVFNMYSVPIISKVSIALFCIAILFLLLNFKKEDRVIFWNKENEPVYSMRVSKMNKQAMENAVEFVRKKIAGTNKTTKPALRQKKTTPKKK